MLVLRGSEAGENRLDCGVELLLISNRIWDQLRSKLVLSPGLQVLSPGKKGCSRSPKANDRASCIFLLINEGPVAQRLEQRTHQPDDFSDVF